MGCCIVQHPIFRKVEGHEEKNWQKILGIYYSQRNSNSGIRILSDGAGICYFSADRNGKQFKICRSGELQAAADRLYICQGIVQYSDVSGHSGAGYDYSGPGDFVNAQW